MLTAILTCVTATALAQRGFGGFGGRFIPFSIQPNGELAVDTAFTT